MQLRLSNFNAVASQLSLTIVMIREINLKFYSHDDQVRSILERGLHTVDT